MTEHRQLTDYKEEDGSIEKLVFVSCPICKNKKKINIPKSIISNSKGLTCITVAPKIVCDHVFQIYLDKHFKIRGYSKSDYEVGFLKVSEDNFQEIKKNTIVKFMEESPEEEIPSEYWPVISKINGIRTVEEIIENSKKDSKFVLNALIDLRSKNLVSFDFFLDDYDIPVLTEKGLDFLLNSEIINEDDKISNFLNLHFSPNPKTDNGKNKNLYDDNAIYSMIKPLLNEKRFDIIKFIDSKSSIITLAENCSINLPNMKNVLKFLQMKGYIEILSKELKLCLIFENIYALFTKSIEEFLGKKGVIIFNKTLESENNPLIKLIKFTDDNFHSFEAVKINIESQHYSNFEELQKLFLSPILNTFKEIKPALSLLSSNYLAEFKNRVKIIFEDLRNTFGIKNMNELKKLLD